MILFIVLCRASRKERSRRTRYKIAYIFYKNDIIREDIVKPFKKVKMQTVILHPRYDDLNNWQKHPAAPAVGDTARTRRNYDSTLYSEQTGLQGQLSPSSASQRIGQA